MNVEKDLNKFVEGFKCKHCSSSGCSELTYHDTQMIKKVIKKAVGWLIQALEGQCEYEDVENKKFIHTDETIRKIVNEAFENVTK